MGTGERSRGVAERMELLLDRQEAACKRLEALEAAWLSKCSQAEHATQQAMKAITEVQQLQAAVKSKFDKQRKLAERLVELQADLQGAADARLAAIKTLDEKEAQHTQQMQALTSDITTEVKQQKAVSERLQDLCRTLSTRVAEQMGPDLSTSYNTPEMPVVQAPPADNGSRPRSRRKLSLALPSYPDSDPRSADMPRSVSGPRKQRSHGKGSTPVSDSKHLPCHGAQGSEKRTPLAELGEQAGVRNVFNTPLNFTDGAHIVGATPAGTRPQVLASIGVPTCKLGSDADVPSHCPSAHELKLGSDGSEAQRQSGSPRSGSIWLPTSVRSTAMVDHLPHALAPCLKGYTG